MPIYKINNNKAEQLNFKLNGFGNEFALRDFFAEIISWNIFQMDGLRYVVPMSCRHETKVIPTEFRLFEVIPATVEKHECEGCKCNRPNRHNGRYVKIMDWNKNKVVRFVDLIK